MTEDDFNSNVDSYKAQGFTVDPSNVTASVKETFDEYEGLLLNISI